MADFPSYERHKQIISTLSGECIGTSYRGSIPGAAGVGSAVWPTANLALYMPLSIWTPFLVTKVFWANGTVVAGNVDCGVYTQDGTQLFAAGSTAQASTSTIQSVSLGTAVRLSPGSYYLALSASSTSATFLRISAAALTLQSIGVAQQATSVPLPATFTPADPTNAYFPLCGIGSPVVI